MDTWTARAAALCDSREPCCRESGVGFDRSQCIENLPSEGAESTAAAISSVDPATAAQTALKIRYDPAKAAECIASLRRPATCLGVDVAAAQQNVGGDPCFEVYSPTLEPGEICTSPGECIGFPDAGCIPAGPEGPLVCHVPEAPVRAGSGELCGGECDGVLCGQSFFARPGLCHSEDGLYCSFATGVARREWRSATVASPIPARAGPMRTAIRPVRFPTPRASAATPAKRPLLRDLQDATGRGRAVRRRISMHG